MKVSVISNRLRVLMSATCMFAIMGCGQSLLKTSIALSTSATMVQPAASVVLTAAVGRTATTGAPLPTGTVMFFDGTTTIGTGTLNSSAMATLTTTFTTTGSHTLTATYEGDANYYFVTSLPVTLTVN